MVKSGHLAVCLSEISLHSSDQELKTLYKRDFSWGDLLLMKLLSHQQWEFGIAQHKKWPEQQEISLIQCLNLEIRCRYIVRNLRLWNTFIPYVVDHGKDIFFVQDSLLTSWMPNAKKLQRKLSSETRHQPKCGKTWF